MEIFKSKWFDRFARKERIEVASLREAVSRAEKGQIDADLGGGIIKQGIADEVEQFKEAARHVLSLSGKQLAELVARADFVEVKSE